MNTLRFIDRRVGYFIAAGLILLATFLPALASAAQITERSIALSSSSVDAKNVTYQVNFTPEEDAGAFVVDFCKESPIIGQACTGPDDFDATAAASTTSGFTGVAALDENTIRVTGSMTGGDTPTDVSVDITGITNPSVKGTIYARIVTFTDATGANAYTSTIPGTHIDDGGIAIAITDTIGVSGAVLESLSFCVANEVITGEGCVGSYGSPILALGETIGSTRALNPDGSLSSDSLYGQLSTNAVGGAVISLKSDATDCGGLMRAGSTDCNIKPAATGTTPAAMELGNDGLFGMLVAAGTDPSSGDNSNGTVQPGTGYGDTNYYMEYVSGNTGGVTSTYGSQIVNTAGAPVNNKGLHFTFGASARNSTPAGMYAADMSMIATGTF